MSKKIWKWVLDNLTDEELRDYAIDLRVQVPGFRDVTQSAVHAKRSILVQKLLAKVAGGEHLGPKRDAATLTRSIAQWQDRLTQGADPVAVLLDILSTDEADTEAKAEAIFADVLANPRPRPQVRSQADQKPKTKPRQRAKPQLPSERGDDVVAQGDEAAEPAASRDAASDGEQVEWRKKYEASQTKVKELRGQLKEQTQRIQELHKDSQALQRDLAKVQRDLAKATTQVQDESHADVELLGLQTVVSRQESLIEKQTSDLTQQKAQIESLQTQLEEQVAENARQLTEIAELRDLIERARYAEAAVSPVAAAFAKAAKSERVVRGRGQTRVRPQAPGPAVAVGSGAGLAAQVRAGTGAGAGALSASASVTASGTGVQGVRPSQPGRGPLSESKLDVSLAAGDRGDRPSVLLVGKPTAANLDLVVRSSDFAIEFVDVPSANERILETGDVAQYDQVWLLSYEVGMRLQGKMERLVSAHRLRLFDNHFELLRYMGTREARERE
ncbi:MAG: hypothetical protein OWU32_13270 [Firmicutes bacterium]|nr:hypothetical protein [Bacillota bacterium]